MLGSIRHGRACPGHPRFSSHCEEDVDGEEDVDARHKAGHDDEPPHLA
jgi:hypothetical protein